VANSYSAPNFNIDTSTDVAGLTILKGSAPALTDLIYVYNGATLTVEGALSILKIILGTTSSGAYGTASGRWGILTVNVGQTITFAGNATAANSGILINPTTADATASKQCQLNINGTAANPCILTNDGDASDINKKWTISGGYGTVIVTHTDHRYHYGRAYTALSGNSATQNIPHKINNCSFMGATGALEHIQTGTLIDTVMDFRFNTFSPLITNTYGIGNTAAVIASGGAVLWDGCVFSSAVLDIFWCHFRQTNGYYMNGRVQYDLNTPTVVVPTGLTFTDTETGAIKVTISNITSYRTQAADSVEDYIQLYDAAGNMRGGPCSKTEYVAALDRKPASCFLVDGVPLSLMSRWYAKATSDNYNYSAASEVAADVAPTFKPIPSETLIGRNYGLFHAEFVGALNASTPTLPSENDVRKDTIYGYTGSEQLGNLLLPIVSIVKKSEQYGANGTELTGTYDPSGSITGAAGISVRERLRQALIWNIQQIKTTDGYNTTIRKVYDPPKAMEQMLEYPSVNVLWGREDRLNDHIMGNNQLLDLSLTARLDIFLSEQENPHNEIDKVLSDIQRRFGMNWYITGANGERTAFNCVYKSADPFGTDLTKPNCGVSIEVEIWYSIQLTNPNVMV